MEDCYVAVFGSEDPIGKLAKFSDQNIKLMFKTHDYLPDTICEQFVLQQCRIHSKFIAISRLKKILPTSFPGRLLSSAKTKTHYGMFNTDIFFDGIKITAEI